jgi:putative hydrolase of the HAD superfamily
LNLVFDFGAVLFTWRPVELMAECFPAHASTPAQAGHLAHEVFGHTEWKAFDRGTLSMPEVIAQIAQRVGLDRGVLQTLVESIGERLTPMPDSIALLRALIARRANQQALQQGQGGAPLKLYYLSNMPAPYARTLERLHGFLTEFDGGIFSADELLIKPEPAIYQLLQNRYALEPSKTVFIDDLLANVQAAQALGWHGIHFKNAPQAMQALQALGLSIK